MSAPMSISRLLSFGYRNATALSRTSLSRCCCRLQRCSSTVSEGTTKRWQLHSAVCLQRYPIISVEPTEFELKYRAYLAEVETNRSLLSDHELRIIADEKKTEPGEEGEMKTQTLVKETLLTSQEMVDEWDKELEQFEFADRVTDADRNNDMTATDRKLEKRLVLITKQAWSESSEPVWIFPQVGRAEGESMREAAERALQRSCGESVTATYVGNAPCGYHKYKLPTGLDNYGVKLFFFKANYHGGDINLQTDVALEHKWVTLDELHEYFSPEYLDDIHKFLIDI